MTLPAVGQDRGAKPHVAFESAFSRHGLLSSVVCYLVTTVCVNKISRNLSLVLKY